MRARMLEGKVDRTKFADDFVPFDVSEDEANYQRPLSLMRTFIAEGTEDNLKTLRRRCKEEKVIFKYYQKTFHLWVKVDMAENIFFFPSNFRTERHVRNDT